MTPTVSFIVPCYKLAHLLPECIESILAQTYSDFEILIMDDCSPDDTSEVAQSFKDPRVKHIRNEANLGHLRNYNKGIELARGKYIWLISADDRLRRAHILERYVELMNSQSKVGFVFCSGVGLQNGAETELLRHYYHGSEDRIFGGREFVSKIIDSGGILSPSVLARRECYERVSFFPLDMPHQGDMYLWCMWALQYDVAYFAEPMVNYRLHESSMMQSFIREKPMSILADELKVLWSVKWASERLSEGALATQCEEAIALKYSQSVVSYEYGNQNLIYSLTLDGCEDSIEQFGKHRQEKRKIKARVYARLGDEHRWRDDKVGALRYYDLALWNNVLLPKLVPKWALLQVWNLHHRLVFCSRAGRKYLERGWHAGPYPGCAGQGNSVVDTETDHTNI